MSKSKSSQSGEPKPEETEAPQGTPSSSAAPSSTWDTSATTAPPSPTFQPTENFQDSEEQGAANLITLFAEKLKGLVEWRAITLGDGRKGYALFFDVAKWERDPKKKTLRVRKGALGK